MELEENELETVIGGTNREFAESKAKNYIKEKNWRATESKRKFTTIKKWRT